MKAELVPREDLRSSSKMYPTKVTVYGQNFKEVCILFEDDIQPNELIKNGKLREVLKHQFPDYDNFDSITAVEVVKIVDWNLVKGLPMIDLT